VTAPDPAPADPAPADPAPADPAPADPAPAGPAPLDAVPPDRGPLDPAPLAAGPLDPDRPRLFDVLPSALAALGLPGVPDRLGLRAALPGVRRIGLLLVDGLGYHLLPVLAPAAPTLAEVLAGRLARLTELASAFPSTTPTSLVSLGTGVAAGTHGVLGFTLNVPGTGRVLNHVEWRDDPDPLAWQPVPTLFDRAAAAGVPVRVLARPEFIGSGLTAAAYRGAAQLPTPDAELADRMLAALHAGPGLVYGYHSALDATAHLSGIDSPQWMAAASEVDQLVARLLDGLPADAALLVTADHGGLDIPAQCRFQVDAEPRLAEGVAVFAGEPRVRYLHTRPGAAAEVLATWRELLGPAARVLSRGEAVAGGWFGPVPEEHLARLGDVVVICRERYAVLGPGEHATLGRLVAFHGADTAAETAIPLIVATR
jgi:Type I phosphodiesterase / nucleotide pyrophosphatase